MLKRLEIAGFKSFARKTVLDFSTSVTAVVGPNGSGKSNTAEAFRFALGEQSMKSMRGKRSEDLIWSGSHTSPRANRASVAVVFDNRSRLFSKFDFDEVIVERAVFRDGASEYSINGSRVRLRDVTELLAAANIGDTGHHIISQGEADRILVASNADRRAMLEDALGLKVFEFKKQEALHKLEKTEANMSQVESLRRELAPHIRFLGKQVEKLERAETLIHELEGVAQVYFVIEEKYVKEERESARLRLEEAKQVLETTSGELAQFDERAEGSIEGAKRVESVRAAERELDKVLTERSLLSRELGKIEGSLESASLRAQMHKEDPYIQVSRDDFLAFRDEVSSQVARSENADVPALRAAYQAIANAVQVFFARFNVPNDDLISEEEKALATLTEDRKALLERDREFEEKVQKARFTLSSAREEVVAQEETSREERQRILQLADVRAKEETRMAREEARLHELRMLEEELERDRKEVFALAGARAFSEEVSIPEEDRHAQEDRKRALERLKIRVEEAGGTGEEVRSEYKEATERDTFLATELEDLARSAEGLQVLITDLDVELSKSFTEGLKKVNESFGEFFMLMFGGGGARLVLEEPTRKVSRASEDDEDTEDAETETTYQNEKPGVEIVVNLPKKRVQSLMQLSGGERALTSIALIFAMSQVNPPPFLILDETDAALDEANSRRYGDMIENLSKKSQLIVITHNRETMSRAGVLYGVTMGGDGISKLLSVKFDEAVAVAK